MTEQQVTRIQPDRRLSSPSRHTPGKGFGLSKPMSELVEALLLSPDLSFRDLVQRSTELPGDIAASRDFLVDRGVLERVRTPRGLPRSFEAHSIRGVFEELQAAYEAGGIHDLAAVHHHALEESTGYARLFRVLQRICPFSELLDLATRLDAGIRTVGLPNAANAALLELRDRWEIHLPQDPSARRILRDAPLIVYGNHPSMLTPFLLAAALEREDLRFVAFGYVSKLVPAMASHIFPVFPTFHRSICQSLSSGLSHLAALSILYRLDRVPSPDKARICNRDAVSQAAGHVRQGGATVIFPAAGRESGPWFPGLGAIIRGASHDDSVEPAYLVPIRVRHNANERVYAAIRRGQKHRAKPKICSQGPIRVEIAAPLPIDPESFAGRPPAEIARQLQAKYEASG